jgi:hypothetical protein
MSDTDTIQQPRTRSSFASRLLTKELNLRKKTTQEMKINPADAAKYANTEEVKETAAVR